MGYYTKKLKKIQSYRGNMPIFSNLTLTRLRAERQPDVDAPRRRGDRFAYTAKDDILLLPISEFCTNCQHTQSPAAQPDVDGAVCLYCQLHYLVIAPVKLWNNLI